MWSVRKDCHSIIRVHSFTFFYLKWFFLTKIKIKIKSIMINVPPVKPPYPVFPRPDPKPHGPAR